MSQEVSSSPERERKPYSERDDVEKMRSQWRKLSGLHTREEWSAAIVRAATAAEIAANIMIRHEFATRSQLSSSFVESQLRWANGLAGKLNHILIPIEDNPQRLSVLQRLRTTAEQLNRVRNAIVHQGEFADPDEAEAFIGSTKGFIEELVAPHLPGFELPPLSEQSKTAAPSAG